MNELYQLSFLLTREQKRVSVNSVKKSHLIAAFIALALFAWVIAHLGLSRLIEQWKAMRVALPIVLILSLIRLVLQSITWSASLKGEDLSVGLSKLMGVRMASETMGYLTVFGVVISEPMKIKLLGTAREPTITATFLDDGVYWFASTMLTVACITSFPLLGVHGATYHWIPGILMTALLVAVVVRRTPVLSGVLGPFGTRAPSWLKRAANIEASIRTYRLDHPALVNRMFWIDLVCQVLMASEVVVVLWSLHLPIRFVSVLAIEATTRMLKMISGWIPARLGSDEGGAISAFALTGFSPILGLSLAFTRRIRDLIGALFGIVWLAYNARQLKDAPDIGRAAAPITSFGAFRARFQPATCSSTLPLRRSSPPSRPKSEYTNLNEVTRDNASSALLHR